MAPCLLGLGSNLGDSPRLLGEAVAWLGSDTRISVKAVSQFARTTPVGGPAGQDPYANGAAVIETAIFPTELLSTLQECERRFGRRRRTRWAARTLDIDLLLYGDQAWDLPGLQIPHPRMTFRPFVLKPAVDIAGEMVYPLVGRTLSSLWEQLQHGQDQIALHDAGEQDRNEVLAVVSSLGASIPVCEGADPGVHAKLTIAFSAPCALPDMGPTLWLAEGLDRSSRRQELLAALQCVWPGVGRAGG